LLQGNLAFFTLGLFCVTEPFFADHTLLQMCIYRLLLLSIIFFRPRSTLALLLSRGVWAMYFSRLLFFILS